MAGLTPLLLSTANRIALPVGNTSGHRRETSDGPSGCTISFGVPPSAETLQRPLDLLLRKTMELSGSQTALSIPAPSQTVNAAPPFTEIFWSLPSEDTKPIHCPSREKNRAEAPSVPRIGRESSRSIDREKICVVPEPTRARYTTRVPSGESASALEPAPESSVVFGGSASVNRVTGPEESGLQCHAIHAMTEIVATLRMTVAIVPARR